MAKTYKPLTAWSYSRYAVYELCPLKFKEQVLGGAKFEGNAATRRGDKLHKSVASYITGGIALESDCVQFPYVQKLINELRTFDDKVVEQQWGFTRKWEPTGWFGDGTWFRNILDVAVLYEDMSADVIDWKSGKKYDSNADQMELNALSLFRHFKPATAVTTRMVYFDTGGEDTADFKKSDEPLLLDKWEKKVAPMFNDTVFNPRPNDKCRFCDFRKSNGGPCRYG
jgi:hypothetical protein